MTRDEIEMQNDYFEWLCHIIAGEERDLRLLTHLDDIAFIYTIPMDSNRAEDGIELRYRFGRERGYDERLVASYLDDRDCSVLEMMIALAFRCEDVMYDPDVGDQTARWFWAMIDSLGLSNMSDKNYNPQYVDATLDIFLNREYSRNGEGGLFTVTSNNVDMRSLEIWYQMSKYLDEVLHEQEGGL